MPETPGEWKEVRRVRPDEYVAAGDLIAGTYLDEGYAGQEYAQLLRDVASRAAAAEVLVAVDPAGEILGTVTYAISGHAFADVALPGESEFRMLAVAPWARRRGIGARLLEACLEHARNDGSTRLVLSTQPRMRAAQLLYARYGFTRLPQRDWSPRTDTPLLVYGREIVARQDS